MRLKAVSGIMLTLLLVGMLILIFNIQAIEASGTIYITSDYTFTHNIYEPIVVLADDIVVDGNGYTLQGTGSGTGIDLSDRSNVTIKNMEIKAFARGIWLYMSSNNSIFGNNIIHNQYGICLHTSSNNTLRNNDVSNNECNFGVYGSLLSHYIQDIDDSNTVNGKPVYYWVNRRDMTVPLDAGYVALINCTHITVKNLHLTNNGQGMPLILTTNSTITGNNITGNEDWGIGLLWGSSNNTISGNNVTHNWHGILSESSDSNTISGNNITANVLYGIYLHDSSNYNTISGNNVTANYLGGIMLEGSSNNTICGNTVKDNISYGIVLFGSSNVISRNNITNSHRGMWLYESSNNSVSGNNITNNGEGVWLTHSSNNKFHHNNFIDNTEQVDIFEPGYANFWDDGYPSGGNYWSDHACTGNPSDGSQPYIINVINIDHYPFQDPNGWLPPPKPVGGKATPINIPMNNPETPVLWIWLITIILPLVLAVVYVKKRKRNTRINS